MGLADAATAGAYTPPTLDQLRVTGLYDPALIRQEVVMGYPVSCPSVVHELVAEQRRRAQAQEVSAAMVLFGWHT